MRESPPIERTVGMAYYASDADGTGGHIREAPEDFRVREIEGVEPEPADADTAAYPHLLVRATLRDWDTNGFATELSNRLGIGRERVAWAGTKDKRAVTTQLFSIDGVAPDALPAMPDADLEVAGRFGRRLHFGDLVGNAFDVAVTGAERPEQVEAVSEELRAFGGAEDPAVAASGGDRPEGRQDGAAVGVPNYFGTQRFGSIRPVTHEVGRRIVDRDWEGAVLAYVGNPHEDEPERTRSARAYAEETNDWTGALDRMPGHLRHERSILHALVASGGESPGDFQEALETLPANLQALFVNAAQSYAFNRMLSTRLERGLPFHRAVEGDVVCFVGAEGDLVVPDADRTQRVTADRVETVNRHVERGRAFVTAPLVGTETDLGAGEPGEIERSVLDDLGLRPDDFDLPGAFGSMGTRRAILVGSTVDVERDPLRFSFALPKGSYATVLLREYTKSPPGEREP